MKSNNYKGVNIDIEDVYYYDRSYFTAFMSELYNTLNPQGFEVTIAVPAKTSDSMWQSWIGAYDYAEIAKVSDKIVLMTYIVYTKNSRFTLSSLIIEYINFSGSMDQLQM